MMMLIHSIAAESRKVLTTRSHYIAILAAMVLSFLPSWFLANSYMENPSAAIAYTFILFSGIGIIAVVVSSVLVVTGEYRYGEITNTFLVTPRRWVVMTSKLIVSTIVAIIISALSHLGAVFIFSIRGVDMSGMFQGENVQHLLMAIFGVLPIVVVAHGIGWVSRSTAITTTAMVIIALGMDNLLGFIPKVGEHIQPLLLMTNVNALWNSSPIAGEETLTHSLVVVSCWIIASLLIAGASVHKRDA